MDYKVYLGSLFEVGGGWADDRHSDKDHHVTTYSVSAKWDTVVRQITTPELKNAARYKAAVCSSYPNVRLGGVESKRRGTERWKCKNGVHHNNRQNHKTGGHKGEQRTDFQFGAMDAGKTTVVPGLVTS